MTVGLTSDAPVGTMPITFTGTIGNTYHLQVSTIALNQDLIVNGGRFRIAGNITGALDANGEGRRITALNGANIFFRQTSTNTGLHSILIQNGVLVLDPTVAGTIDVGTPITLAGPSSSIFKGDSPPLFQTICKFIRVLASTGILVSATRGPIFSGSRDNPVR
jgi:hypothetical protein